MVSLLYYPGMTVKPKLCKVVKLTARAVHMVAPDGQAIRVSRMSGDALSKARSKYAGCRLTDMNRAIAEYQQEGKLI